MWKILYFTFHIYILLTYKQTKHNDYLLLLLLKNYNETETLVSLVTQRFHTYMCGLMADQSQYSWSGC